MTETSTGGRANQRKRTRDAIVRAATELMLTGREITMPDVARAALVSEATAYRYFPDLATLLSEAMVGELPDPAEALASVADSADPVLRVAAATEHLLRLVLARQGAVRAMIAAAVIRPGGTVTRPALRTGLINYALAPLSEPGSGPGRGIDAATLEQLKLGLAVIVSAEALFSLTDLHGLDPGQAVASLVQTATTLTRAMVGQDEVGQVW
jgi:AcrR family transcriptional regulator